MTAAALLLVLVIAGSLLVHTSRMLLGTAPPVGAAGSPGPVGAPLRATGGAALALAEPVVAAVPRASGAGADVWAMAGALLTCAVLGIWIGPLGTLLQQATAMVTGTP